MSITHLSCVWDSAELQGTRPEPATMMIFPTLLAKGYSSRQQKGEGERERERERDGRNNNDDESNNSNIHQLLPSFFNHEFFPPLSFFLFLSLPFLSALSTVGFSYPHLSW